MSTLNAQQALPVRYANDSNLDLSIDTALDLLNDRTHHRPDLVAQHLAAMSEVAYVRSVIDSLAEVRDQ